MGLTLAPLMLMAAHPLTMPGRRGTMSWRKGWLSANMSSLTGWPSTSVDASRITRMGITSSHRWLTDLGKSACLRALTYPNWPKLLRRSCRRSATGFLRNSPWTCMTRWIEEKMMQCGWLPKTTALW
uniref:Alternative protein GIT1 n=1 Tax=Homo sapiens TaxID=9606 RepID=L0R865_HUMAN|nr:alternative protein GIT1 [Homo sapiens]